MFGFFSRDVITGRMKLTGRMSMVSINQSLFGIIIIYNINNLRNQ